MHKIDGYDPDTDTFANDRMIEDNITNMTLNNSISFQSSLKFSTKPAMKGQNISFDIF